MRSIVAVVEAHPETIRQDYARVLKLAKLAPGLGAQEPVVALQLGRGGFLPGWSATPWQLDAVLEWLGEKAAGAQVFAVDGRGAASLPDGPAWQDSLIRHRAVAAAGGFLTAQRHQSQLLHPSLDTVLAKGVEVPAGLAGAAAIVGVAPSLVPEWGLAGAGALLSSLVTGGRVGRGPLIGRRRAPAAEIMAEAVGIAREVIPNLGVVVDGTLWGVRTAAGARRCVARQVLLAGSDPLSVDAVAMRLAGLDPQRVPWLRIGHDRGFGQILPSEIQVVGRRDFLNLDFELPTGTFAAGRRNSWAMAGNSVGRWLQRVWRRQSAGPLSGTGWDRLNDHYAAGSAAETAGPG